MDAALIQEWGPAVALVVVIVERLFSLLKESQSNARADYVRLEKHLHLLSAKLSETEVAATALIAELRHSQRRDTEFHNRQWPAHMAKIVALSFDVNVVRDSVNEVRARLDMPLTHHTPPMGVPIMPIQDHVSTSIKSPYDILK